ncbi:unnamed protein product, partial [Mesocestoides corti]
MSTRMRSINSTAEYNLQTKENFIRRCFTCKECTQFVGDSTAGSPELRCGCGELLENHFNPNEKSSQTVWSPACIKTVGPSNAYGVVKFFSGAQNLRRSAEKVKGLIGAAQASNAWILTDGLDWGVVSVVSDATEKADRYYFSKGKMSDRFRCIGVTPWGHVLNRERLIRSTDAEWTAETGISLLESIMEHENLVSCVVFDAMGTGDTFDKAILYALIKSSTTDPNDQLLIALKFGRIDVVQEEILSKGVNYLKSKMRPNKLKDIMTTALLEDRTEFVQFLIDLELVKMQTYLDMSTLNWLYNNVEDASILKTTLNYYGVVMKQSSPSLVGTALMATTANVLSMDTETAGEANKVLEMLFQRRSVRAKRDWTNLPTISELLLKMLGSFSSPYYEDIMVSDTISLVQLGGNTSCCSLQELFIWAVLYNRNDLAMLFWQYADDAISLGLIGCNLYHKIARALPSYDTNGQLMLATQKLCLEQVSKAMIELCYSKSNVSRPEKALYLLERPLITWGDHRCMPLAVHAECREFIASVACQHAIDFEWRAGIHANPVALILGYMCPLLLCTTKLIRFEEPSKLLEVATGDDIFQQLGKRLKPTLDTTKDEEEPSIPNSKKLEMFYRAPRTKFCAHTASSIAFYAVFLVFFSYTLLFGLKADRVTVLEAILMVYLFSFGVETVRSFVKSAWERGSVGFHLAKWLRGNKWHPYDVALIFGCATAIALRLGLEETFIYAKSVYSIVHLGIVIEFDVEHALLLIVVVFFFLRLFQMYAVNRKLGPKSVMIFHMLVELAVFLLILLIFLVPYGISTQAVLFPY